VRAAVGITIGLCLLCGGCVAPGPRTVVETVIVETVRLVTVEVVREVTATPGDRVAPTATAMRSATSRSSPSPTQPPWLATLEAKQTGRVIRIGTPIPTLTPTALPPNTLLVTYQVGGATSRASVTCVNAQGGTEQHTEASVPWQMDFGAHNGTFVYVSAQNLSDWGSVSCRILINRRPWRSSSSSGGFAVASCSGMVGD